MSLGSSSAALRERLSMLAVAGRMEEMGAYLSSLSHSQHRVASRLLAESVLPEISGEAFWRAFSYLSLLNPRAYLGTCLRAAERAYVAGHVRFEGEALGEYGHQVAEREMNVDRSKFLRAALPLLHTHEEFTQVWRLMKVGSAKQRVAWLMGCEPSVEVYCELFCEVRREGDDVEFIRRTAIELIRRGDRLSFNLAAIICGYFGVEGVKATFALRLQPYQLSRLDSGREKIKQLLTEI